MKSDIQDRADIRKLVISFYERLLKEEDFKTHLLGSDGGGHASSPR